MASSFYSPRNQMCALWASAVESHLRDTHPELSTGEIRKLPMMQGVYQHLSDIGKSKRQPSPEAKTTSEVDQYAQLSQVYLDLGVTTMLFSQADPSLYQIYVNTLDSLNNTLDIADFSTDDLGGFALCLIMWVGLVGMSTLSTIEQELIDALIDGLPLTGSQKQQLQNFWNQVGARHYSLQYKDANSNTGYQVIPWKLPTNSQVIMLGDWGTSLDDAHELLYAVWKHAYQANPTKTIVFIHLGDIYYCGLPYECKNYFYNVFLGVGQRIKSDLNNDPNFITSPPIFTIPGNHEYYSYGYGYFQLLGELNSSTPNIHAADLQQTCSFFCLRSSDNHWQFLGMDTGQDDYNAMESLLQSIQPYAVGILEGLVPFSIFFDKYINEIYQDMAGPFAPTLRSSEINWLENKLNGFQGKTILCSHHQLFSRQAEINHSNPQYMNSHLMKTFSPYFKSQIAAWYWGHEHTYAIYQDGIYGLNKGRLLGSSSYEDTQENDNPYQNKYPMVPFDSSMNPVPIHNTNGLYYHACAIFIPNGSSMGVTYYQFPAWNNLSTPPSNPQLTAIHSETITTSFKSLQPSWIGNYQVQQDTVVTDKNPSITSWNNVLYLVFANASKQIAYAKADISNFHPTSNSAKPSWVYGGTLASGGTTLTTTNSPATVAVNGLVYVFFVDSNANIQCMYYDTSKSSWKGMGAIPSGSNDGKDLVVADSGLATCFYNNLIYVVFRQAGSANNLCSATYDPVAKTWAVQGKMKDTSGNDMESELCPALAASYDRMIMAFQQSGTSTDIQWAEMNGNTNGKWNTHGDVNSTQKNGNSTKADTSIGLTLNYLSGVWYLLHTSDDNQMRLSCLDDDTNAWYGNSPITVNRNNNNKSTPLSSEAPALTIANGGGFLVYRGEDHDEIYWAYF